MRLVPGIRMFTTHGADCTRCSGRWKATAALAAVLAVLLSAIVFAQRGLAAWQASGVPPGVAVTSGFEEESLYAVWRSLHGEPIYVDGARLPYASAYFNWLFYSAYVTVLKPVVTPGTASLIPRAGRIVTAIGAISGAIVLFLLLRRILDGALGLPAAVAAFVFFGPLVGWWAHTVRPDVWALALEAGALASLLAWHRERPWRATLVSLGCFYAAWSFKQSYALGLLAGTLFLGSHRKWRHALALLTGSMLLWAVTAAALGPGYRAAQHGTFLSNTFYYAHGWNNLRNALEKSLPLIVLAVWAGTRQRGRDPHPSPLPEDATRLGWIGVAVSLPFAFAASCKLGAWSNYFFSTALLLTLAGAGGFSLRPSRVVSSIVCAMIAVMQLGASFGWAGRVHLDDETRFTAQAWEMFRSLPEPRFTSENRLQLPWLNPGSPALVLAYNYDQERRSGRPFEHGGVGGLIERGYFASMLLPAGTGDTFLGGKLAHYSRGETACGLTTFRRIEPPPVR